MDWMLMPLRRYAEFTGRSRRKEYWMFALLVTLVYLVLGAMVFSTVLPLILGQVPAESLSAASFSATFWVGCTLGGLVILGTLVPSIAVNVRRLHDRDMSGWWYLGMLIGGQIPFAGPLISIGYLVLMCLPGAPGPNRFGEDPLDPDRAEVFA